jgi:type 1 glutamine amidotransferase
LQENNHADFWPGESGMSMSRLRVGFLLTLLGAAGLTAAEGTADSPEKPLRIHLIGIGEYKPVESLTELKKYLEERYRVEITTSFSLEPAQVYKAGKPLPNLESLKSAEVMVIFARRMNLPEEQMALIRGHWEKGKPIVAMRTASHAFQEADNVLFKQVIGGEYSGAASYTAPFKAIPAEGQAEHPVLQGVGPMASRGYYGFKPLAKDSVVLQAVDEPERKLKRPVTWVHTYKGGRMFYTSMGVPEDFRDENFRRLLANAIFWTSHRDPEKVKRK